MSAEPTFEGTGAIEGTLPAEQLSFDSDGTLEPRTVRNSPAAHAGSRRWRSRSCAHRRWARSKGPTSTPSWRICARATGLDEAAAHAADRTDRGARRERALQVAAGPDRGPRTRCRGSGVRHMCGSAQRSTSCARRHGRSGRKRAESQDIRDSAPAPTLATATATTTETHRNPRPRQLSDLIEATPHSRSRPCAAPRAMAVAKPPCAAPGAMAVAKRGVSRQLMPDARGVETVGGGVGLATHGGAETLSSQYVGRAGGEDLAERNNPRNNRGLRVFSGPLGRTTTGQIDAR